MTADSRGMNKADADIMEERRFFDKGEIDPFSWRQTSSHGYGLGSDGAAVSKEDLPGRIAGRIVLLQERPGVQAGSSSARKWR